MNTNQARAYEEIDAANADWLNKDYERDNARLAPSTPDAWSRERSQTGGVIRLRLNLRDRTAPGAEAAEDAGRKRSKRTPAQTEKDQTPPPRPRIVWRREDENETRPPPAIIME
ncbi:MAG: hypothetical protein ABI740_06180 [Alphaproteobacteria bacterium]